jgi:HTH-type transcriptional regulator / antitoxin HigA
MITGFKLASSYYMELITTFPPRPIANEAEFAATQKRINSILDQKVITQDDRDYLMVGTPGL